jgi:hypothetical protein
MKALILTLVTLSSSLVFAQIPADVEKVGFIAGEVVSVSPLCPPGARCITDGTSLKIRFTMGCLDQFGEYDYRRTEDGIVVGMIGMSSAKSKVVRCVRANTKDVTLTLVNAFPPFEVQFMGQNNSVQVSGFNRE